MVMSGPSTTLRRGFCGSQWTGHIALNYLNPGTGGRFFLTWTAVLPADGTVPVSAVGPTFWWGGAVSDPNPHALFGQAFLEVQFYPDSVVSTCSSDGGYNVMNAPDKFTVCSPVWQINTQSGAEDAAFNAELYDGTSKSPLVMSAGDTVRIHFHLGAAGQGWNVTVTDLTTGHSGTIVLNSKYGPLLPLFSSQQIGNALGWGLVDDTPNSFVWEIGHTSNFSTPAGRLCNPGQTDCDSYNTASWLGITWAGVAGSSVIPRELPPGAPHFTGRIQELSTLTRLLDRSDRKAPGTVAIGAIGGTAGVGKTALALHWAHRVAEQFTDGQLHVNLRGFAPSGTPATPAEAVRGFLDALGVPPERIPPTADAQVGLYRSLLVERKMLIVLDNARDEQQVRPLLPASPASLVVVTSRNQLAGLAAADGARLVSPDVLAHDEAVQLLTARIGASRAAAEPDAMDEIAALCAGLPLALAVAAARAAARPGFPLTELAAELRGADDRLDALDAGDPAVNVRAVFSWSYRQLSPEPARMFRLLGLHPDPDISVPAAASLAAVDEPHAHRLLRELTHDCLITEHMPGRYAFHGLLRAYAADKARECDSEPDRGACGCR
jgi:hypothetical protein